MLQLDYSSICVITNFMISFHHEKNAASKETKILLKKSGKNACIKLLMDRFIILLHQMQLVAPSFEKFSKLRRFLEETDH